LVTGFVCAFALCCRGADIDGDIEFDHEPGQDTRDRVDLRAGVLVVVADIDFDERVEIPQVRRKLAPRCPLVDRRLTCGCPRIEPARDLVVGDLVKNSRRRDAGI
jgi:hypothetical protein